MHPALSWYELALAAAAAVAGAGLLERRLRRDPPPRWSRTLDRALLEHRVDPDDVDDEPTVRLVRPRLYDQDDPQSLDRLDPGLVRWGL